MVFVPAMFGSGGFEVVGVQSRQTWSSPNNPRQVGWPADIAPGDLAILLVETFGNQYANKTNGLVYDTGWTSSPPTFFSDPNQTRKGLISHKILTSTDISGLPPQINDSIAGAWILLVVRGANQLSTNRASHALTNGQNFTPVSLSVAGGLGKSLTSVFYLGFTYGGRYGTDNVHPSPDYGFVPLNDPTSTVVFWLLPAESYTANAPLTFVNFNDDYNWRSMFFQEVTFE